MPVAAEECSEDEHTSGLVHWSPMDHGSTSLFASQTLHVAEFRGAALTPELTEERGDGTASLTIIRRGTHLHHARGRIAVADPGSSIVHRGLGPYRLSHPFPHADVDVSLFVEFGAALLDELFGNEGLQRDLGHPLSPATLLAAAMTRNALGQSSHDTLSREERTIELLRRAAEDLATVRADSASVEAAMRRVILARDQLASAPEQDFSLAELAREAGCSPFHLSRLFRRATGMTLRGFRLRLRLAAVLDGLAEGENSLTDLAVRTGFVDHAHMSNSFRRTFGVTPSLAREQLGTAGLVNVRKRIQARAARCC